MSWMDRRFERTVTGKCGGWYSGGCVGLIALSVDIEPAAGGGEGGDVRAVVKSTNVEVGGQKNVIIEAILPNVVAATFVERLAAHGEKRPSSRPDPRGMGAIDGGGFYELDGVAAHYTHPGGTELELNAQLHRLIEEFADLVARSSGATIREPQKAKLIDSSLLGLWPFALAIAIAIAIAIGA